jgi:thiosulfate reductase cytochrome b subunit
MRSCDKTQHGSAFNMASGADPASECGSATVLKKLVPQANIYNDWRSLQGRYPVHSYVKFIFSKIWLFSMFGSEIIRIRIRL